MNEIMAMVIVATVAYAIYRLFELFARRRERIAIIEKLSDGLDLRLLEDPFRQQMPRIETASWGLRIGLLLLGIGLGVFIAAIIEISVMFPIINVNGDHSHQYYSVFNALYPACAAIFGGTGLVIAYFVENKKNKKKHLVKE